MLTVINASTAGMIAQLGEHCTDKDRCRGRGFESRSEHEIFSGLCSSSSSVMAALALMTVSLHCI